MAAIIHGLSAVGNAIVRAFQYASDTEVSFSEGNYRQSYAFLRKLHIPENAIPDYVETPPIFHTHLVTGLYPQIHVVHIANVYHDFQTARNNDRVRLGVGRSRFSRAMEKGQKGSQDTYKALFG